MSDQSVLAGKKHLITGGAGLIGSHIADLLVGEEAGEIVILDDFSRGTMKNLEGAVGSGRINVLRGDIRDEGFVKEAMAGVDTVFHQAAIRITLCAQEPRLAHDVLSTGTYNVLEAARDSGVRKIVAASSASVYGQAVDFPTTEEHHPYANRTFYGAAKVYLEGMLRAFNDVHELDYVALRYFNVYGPRMDTHGKYTEVLVRWMERIEDGQPPLIFGDGNQTMDFVFVEDVARANVLAAKAAASDVALNVATGLETSLKELAASLAEVMGSDLAPEYGPERKVNPVARRLAEVETAREAIGFEASVSLAEGLGRLVDWWRRVGLA